MTTAVVSVVVPVYNVERYLPTCVDSLLAQTYPEIQIVLVDDGSCDASRTLCDDYARLRPRVLTVHRKNGGLSAARNTGLRHATGEFVLFLDSDDWIEADAVERLVATARQRSASIVVCGFHLDVHDENEVLITSTPRVPTPLTVDGALEDPRCATREMLGFAGYAWNKLYRRELIEGSMFPEGISLVEDIVFNGLVLARADRVVFVAEPLVHYVQRPRVTLGNGFQPAFGSLVLSAGDAVRRLLTSWGVPGEQTERMVLEVSYGRTQWALRGLAVNGDIQTRTRRAQMKLVLQDPHVRRILPAALAADIPARFMRPLIWFQARGLAWPTYLFHALRRRRPW